MKGGENVTLAMLKDFLATVEGNRAQLGLFVTLATPTWAMREETAKYGYYESPDIQGQLSQHTDAVQRGVVDGTGQPR